MTVSSVTNTPAIGQGTAPAKPAAASHAGFDFSFGLLDVIQTVKADEQSTHGPGYKASAQSSLSGDHLQALSDDLASANPFAVPLPPVAQWSYDDLISFLKSNGYPGVDTERMAK